jgi:drug/metabolite transporter (DMT)-like permease
MGLGRSPGRRGAYSIVVYSAAAATLLPVALGFEVRLCGYSGETWFWLAAITAGPQLMGHTVFNWALPYVQASIISGTILAALLASPLRETRAAYDCGRRGILDHRAFLGDAVSSL